MDQPLATTPATTSRITFASLKAAITTQVTLRSADTTPPYTIIRRMRPLLVAALLAGCGDNRIVADAPASTAVPSCVRSGTTVVLHPLAPVQRTLTHVTSPPGDERIFAVQDAGVIRILDQD